MSEGDWGYQWPKMNMLRMIGQVSEGYNHFERVLVRQSRICEVVRAEESCEAQVFYFCNQSFPIWPGKAILALNLYGYCYHVYKLLFCLFLALSVSDPTAKAGSLCLGSTAILRS